jgi:uncharacterized protein involved in exopolysaccharide biosynthesis
MTSQGFDTRGAVLPDDDEIPIANAVAFLRRQRVPVISAIVACVVLVVTYLFLRPATFTASATFTPQTTTNQSSLAGLASQLGIAVPVQDASRSPAFYADLLVSRKILGAIVDSGFRQSGTRPEDREALAAFLKVRGSTAAVRREKSIDKLRKRINRAVIQRTGLVSVSVSTPNAALSHRILAHLLDHVDQFNRLTRQSQADAERRFTEARLGEVGGELRDAENALQRFMQENRAFRNSPELNFQEQRLQRALNLRQAVFTTLSQELEQAKIEAVRDTPLITIVEPPELPARPDPRGFVKGIPLAIVGGLALGVLVGLLRESRRDAAVVDSLETLHPQRAALSARA